MSRKKKRKAERKAELERIRTLFRARALFWLEAFGLKQWTRHFIWNYGKAPLNKRGWVCKVSTSSDWKYLETSFTIYLRSFAYDSDESLDNTACHEALHAALDEMREWRHKRGALEHEERVVTTLSDALSDMVAGLVRAAHPTTTPMGQTLHFPIFANLEPATANGAH